MRENVGQTTRENYWQSVRVELFLKFVEEEVESKLLRDIVARWPQLSIWVSCIEVLFRRKILVFVYRVINGLASPLFNPYFSLASQTADGTHRITRGQETRLLLVPFLPGPAGRASIRFQGSIVWNELPPNARSAKSRELFTRFLQ